MSEYRVKLDIYNGPLDLLLFLIQREEIDIHDIPISKVTEQYCAYVETLKLIDPDLAGEFLVMAATLMEIKTRMLLPRPEAKAEDEELFDPRAELVRKLLEYKAFKDAAGELGSAAARQSLQFPRRPAAQSDDGAKDLEDVQVWDLVEAFSRLMVAIGQAALEAEIIYDDTPVELHAEDILDRLRREGNLAFRQIFEGRSKRSELVGLFLAVLELVRRRSVFVEQQQAFGEIYLFLNPEAPAEGDSAAEPTRGQAPPGEYQSGPSHERRVEAEGDGDPPA